MLTKKNLKNHCEKLGVKIIEGNYVRKRDVETVLLSVLSEAQGNLKISKPKEDDIEQSEKLYEKMLGSNRDDAPEFVIKQNDDVIAAIWSSKFTHPSLGFVTEFDVVVDKKFQKQGYARKLVEKLKKQTRGKLIAKPWSRQGLALVKSLGMKPLDHEYWSWK